MTALLFSAVLLFLQSTPQPSPVVGDWIGTLSGANLRLAIHIKADASGTLIASLDSIDQGVRGLPFASVTVTGDRVRLEMTTPQASFEGTLSADRAQIDGNWMQNGGTLPLLLKRGVPEPPKRPQDPKRPYPYSDEEVTYQNKEAGITLAGTLTLPRTAAPSPAVILITGSGPEDRDETVFGHRPFLILADHLTRNGIAVLRVDDRGVGRSTGSTRTSTSEDFARDVIAGIEYLKTRKEVDPKRIGLVGHSEGGLIAPMVAAQSGDVAFIVLMAGPGLPGEQILYLQGAAIAKAGGAAPEAIEANRSLQAQIFKIVKEEPDSTLAATKLRALSSPGGGVPAPQIASVTSPWFRYFLTYDPRPTLARVKCPVLAINGELDLQVPYQENLDAIGAALKTGGNANVTLVHLPGLNHLFQAATTGSPTEYMRIEETMNPAALDAITSWLQKVAGLKA